MINKAEKYKEEDKKRRELVDLKNEADSTIHNTESSLNEHRSKLGQQDIEEIEREITTLRGILADNTLGGNDVQRVKDAI